MKSRGYNRGKSYSGFQGAGNMHHMMKKSALQFPQLGNSENASHSFGQSHSHNSILNHNSQQLVQSSGLQYGACTEQGKRPYQEDEYSIHLYLGDNRGGSENAMAVEANQQSTHFFGLFDGHAGGRCSKYVAANLPDLMSNDPLFHSNLPQCVRRTFHGTNEQFLKIAEKMRIHDGSTGLTCIIRGNKLLVANVGDCRALLLTSERANQLSVDQKPTSIDEQRRINSLGGTVEYCMGVARVNRVLAVSRAFGNRTLKQVIRPDAELTARELTKNDEYLIMASDGLWDVLKNKDVFEISKAKHLHQDPQAIADELVRTALMRGSMDNTTCLVVKLTNYLNKLNCDDKVGLSQRGADEKGTKVEDSYCDSSMALENENKNENKMNDNVNLQRLFYGQNIGNRPNTHENHRDYVKRMQGKKEETEIGKMLPVGNSYHNLRQRADSDSKALMMRDMDKSVGRRKLSNVDLVNGREAMASSLPSSINGHLKAPSNNGESMFHNNSNNHSLSSMRKNTSMESHLSTLGMNVNDSLSRNGVSMSYAQLRRPNTSGSVGLAKIPQNSNQFSLSRSQNMVSYFKRSKALNDSYAMGYNKANSRAKSWVEN